jgi:uncharacterized membrane protein
VVEAMREPLRAGRFEEGLNIAIDAVGRMLALQYPGAAGVAKPNELPDAPWVG